MGKTSKTKIISSPNYNNWVRKQVKITDLFLDPENIRLQVEVQSSQEALINDLFFNENAMQVLTSIIHNGFFPDEVPVVIEEDNKLVVIDGNRRVAALKVLARPEIVPPKEVSVKKLLKSAGSLLKEINVVIATDRDSIRRFLASKHTQDTKRPWRPFRQAYFYKAELERGKTVQDLRNEYPGVKIDKFLKLINVHKIAKSIKYDLDRITKKVHNERTFPASTIERLYKDKQVRKFLGFEFGKDGELNITIQKKEFEKGFKKIIQDVADKAVDSRALGKEEDRKKYLASFSQEDTPGKKKGSKNLTSGDFHEKKYIKIKKRKKLAPNDIQFKLQAPGVKRVLQELQTIDYHKFPNASHDLLRSFLECSLKVYFEDKCKPIKPPRGKRHVYLDNVLQEFKKEMDLIKNIELSQVTQKIISNVDMQSYTAQFLNATNHNPSIFATDKDVENAWDAMEKLFRYILNPSNDNDTQ